MNLTDEQIRKAKAHVEAALTGRRFALVEKRKRHQAAATPAQDREHRLATERMNKYLGKDSSS